ncbi:MAG TPA: hypothetical protein VHV30_15885 [Polyangiaceae bacterium]|jgi:hypothetical protein|nr:hypothetical protein [Polyangiaceae bacterium]
MGVLEAAARIIELGGAPQEGRGPRVSAMRAAFEARTGAFAPEDPWFEERSRAFWCDAITLGRFGREVEGELAAEDRAWLGPLERAHRGLFRRGEGPRERAGHAGHDHEEWLVDVWSGAELLVNTVDDASRAELDAAAGQLFDARVAGAEGLAGGPLIALLPGAVFHPLEANAAIDHVLAEARGSDLPTNGVLDALLRMQRSLRALSRVKPAYAYRVEALRPSTAPPPIAVRRHPKDPT